MIVPPVQLSPQGRHLCASLVQKASPLRTAQGERRSSRRAAPDELGLTYWLVESGPCRVMLQLLTIGGTGRVTGFWLGTRLRTRVVTPRTALRTAILRLALDGAGENWRR